MLCPTVNPSFPTSDGNRWLIPSSSPITTSPTLSSSPSSPQPPSLQDLVDQVERARAANDKRHLGRDYFVIAERFKDIAFNENCPPIHRVDHYNLAKDYLNKAIQEGNPDGYYGHALLQFVGFQVGPQAIPPDPTQAFTTLLQAERAGCKHPSLFETLSKFILRGIGTEPDLLRALPYLERGALGGSVYCIRQLVTLYTHGGGSVHCNPRRAFELKRLAVSLGIIDIPFLLHLACTLVEDEGIEHDYQAAAGYLALAALQGSPEGFYGLARLYTVGLPGIPADYPRAYALYLEAEKRGCTLVDLGYFLGIMEENGLGTPVNIQQALAHYEHAISAGHALSLYRRAHLLDTRIPPQIRDVESAKVCYIAAADAGCILNGRIRFALGKLCQDQAADVDKNIMYQSQTPSQRQARHISLLKEAIQNFKTSGIQGMAEGHYWAGGLSLEAAISDPTTACKQLLLAHDKGFRSSMLYRFLGYLYCEGQGVSKDPIAAIKWYSEAAQIGDPGAYYETARILKHGHMAVRDYSSALSYMIQADQHHLNDHRLYHDLGDSYDTGKGVPPDPLKAAKYYAIAIQLGSTEALVPQAALLISGRAGVVDKQLAFNYLKQAKQANISNRDLDFMLGVLYSPPDGIEVDAKLAIQYLTLAHKAQHIHAAQRLGLVYFYGSQGMNPDWGTAEQWFTQALANYPHAVDALGYAALGDIYGKGSSRVQQQIHKAIEMYGRGCALGDSACMKRYRALTGRTWKG